MKATKENIHLFKPGMWYSLCCIECLYQAETQEDVQDEIDLFNDLIEDGDGMLMFWETKEEAIEELYNPDIITRETRMRLGIGYPDGAVIKVS
jgi:hypothetical protein